MELLYGKPIADKILENLKRSVSSRSEKPGLAVVLVGNNQASRIYVALKEKRAKEIGMDFSRFDLPENASEGEVAELIGKLNADAKVHGIIVQLPLPDGFDTKKIIASIAPEKDADGFSAAEKSAKIQPVFPHAIVRLIESSGEALENKQAVVIANSDEFGRVARAALERKKMSAEYILSQDIPSNLGKIKAADVVVSAVGSPGLLRGEMFKDGALVVDGGIEKVADRIFGDVDFASTEGKKGFLSPVPGGVGPVTIACLLENVYLAFEAQQRE